MQKDGSDWVYCWAVCDFRVSVTKHTHYSVSNTSALPGQMICHTVPTLHKLWQENRLVRKFCNMIKTKLHYIKTFAISGHGGFRVPKASTMSLSTVLNIYTRKNYVNNMSACKSSIKIQILIATPKYFASLLVMYTEKNINNFIFIFTKIVTVQKLKTTLNGVNCYSHITI
jgi:hypothetical protein